jgi:hypothetical protein
MKKRRTDSQWGKKRPPLQEPPLRNGSQLAEFSERRLDAIIRTAGQRYSKIAEEGKFTFLKHGRFSAPTKKADPPSRSDTPSRFKLSPREDKVLQAAESLDISTRVERTLSDFIGRASTGDRILVSRLLGFAVEIVTSLNAIAIERPELVRPISRQHIFWPALISRKRFIKESNERLMKSIQLGSGDRFTTRGWQLSKPSTQAALDLTSLEQAPIPTSGPILSSIRRVAVSIA